MFHYAKTAEILRKSVLYSKHMSYYSPEILYVTYFDIRPVKNACEVPVTSN